MTKALRYAALLLIGLLVVSSANAQIQKDPSKWSVEVKKKSANEYDLVFHVRLEEGWHVYSLNPGGDGLALPPEFTIAENSNIKKKGKTKERGKIVHETIEGLGTYNYYKHSADFIQTITASANTTVKGEYFYQICDDKGCLPPVTKPYSVKITGVGEPVEGETTAEENTDAVAATGTDTATTGAADTNAVVAAGDNGTLDNKDLDTDTGNAEGNKKQEQKSKWLLFFASLGGGILAVITPCVFSMIPITVSFFTKRSKTRAEGIKNAIYYSLSIIIIFTGLGVLVSLMFGANALNNLSTNWIANLVFFFIFIIFGISFLGAFEITLPSSWTSKTDKKAGLGSFGGIFFMALTLVIVSFSCTGPIIGPLLVLAGKGGIGGPAIGMFGFSIGLALPFALFAVFPGMLNKMASSGGWLNQVKVVLGFIEIGLALKFLSNADLAQGWRLLDREIFIAIWIVLAIMLGIYLLGKLKLSHDDASPKNIYGQEYVSIFKLFLAIVSFTFAVYLLPGMWGAPLNGMSQFVPPMGTQDFVIGTGDGGGSSSGHGDGLNGIRPVKYAEELKIYEPPVVMKSGLVTFYDYDEALAASKKLKKPVMLDFTGINCVNCRKMEVQVWSKPEVMKRLKEDFIVASLYCDWDKKELPEGEQFYSKELNSQVTTVGDYNEHLQAEQFNSSSQPFYFFVDENGVKLAEEGYSYDPDVEQFVEHLDKVKENYKKLHP